MRVRALLRPATLLASVRVQTEIPRLPPEHFPSFCVWPRSHSLIGILFYLPKGVISARSLHFIRQMTLFGHLHIRRLQSLGLPLEEGKTLAGSHP